jgi:hypothetical protein
MTTLAASSNVVSSRQPLRAELARVPARVMYGDYRKLLVLLLLASLSPAVGGAEPRTAPPGTRAAPPPMIINPTNRVLLQRGFVPVNGALRLYACVVGTPAGVHYAYDMETGALLSVWRRPFADMVEIWGPRARNQTARAAGHEIALTAKPLVAQFPDRMMIEFPKAWPMQPAPLYASAGYELEKNGQPTFLAKFEDLVIRDRIVPTADGRRLTRTLEFSGRLPEWQTWLLFAEADAIEPTSEGWTAGAGNWTVQWPRESPHHPTVRADNSRQMLVLRLDRATLDAPLQYSISW